MDAVKFIEERRRMSKVTRGYSPIMNERISPENIVKEVEEWAAAHPRKTLQSVFLEHYPEARLDGSGVLSVCPKDVYGDTVCPKNKWNPYTLCCDCRRKFWTKVVG